MDTNVLTQFLTHSPVTAVMMVVILLSSCLAFYNRKVFSACFLHPYSIIREKAWYRIFTADLVHNDFVHLGLNLFMLYVFCSDLEEKLGRGNRDGSLQFLMIYAMSLLTAAVVITFRHYKDFEYSSTGPSGSIMGCMFSFMLLEPYEEELYLPVVGGVSNVYACLLYIGVLILYRNRKGNQMINHEAHFFGAVGGIAGTLLLFPELIKYRG